MQLILVLSAALGVLAYSGELPALLQFPAPLTGSILFTITMVYALIKA